MPSVDLRDYHYPNLMFLHFLFNKPFNAEAIFAPDPSVCHPEDRLIQKDDTLIRNALISVRGTVFNSTYRMVV